MWKKKITTDTGTTHSLLSGQTVIEGDIHSDGNIRIEGTANGDIRCKAKIVIGSQGSVRGDIKCVDIEIMGSLQGNAAVSNLFSLRSGSRFEGLVHTPNIEVEQGACFLGSCQTMPEAKAEE